MLNFYHVLTVVGAVVGALFLAGALLLWMSAPQQAAAAAIGIGFAVIPYCLAGGAERYVKRCEEDERAQRDRV